MTNVLPTQKHIWECMVPMELNGPAIITIQNKIDTGFSNRNHVYFSAKQFGGSNSLSFELKEGQWTPPHYYVYGYVASFKKRTASPRNIIVRERHFNWANGNFIHEVVRTFQYNQASIYRHAGTYISITSASGTLIIDADKDFDGDTN